MSNLPTKYDRGELERPDKLYRDLESGKLGGVCSGIAIRTNTPAAVWRLAFVLTTLMWGIGLPLYAILWMVMDRPPKRPALAEADPDDLSPEDREIWDAVKSDMKSLDLRND